MAFLSIKGVSMVLKYKSGSLTYSHLKPNAGNEAIYELGLAVNSLQAEPAESISKTVASYVVA
jgi:hypothetical protein